MDTELQQRALEYGGLGARPDVAKLNVLAMPHWEKRKSLLLRRLAEKEVKFSTKLVTLMMASAWACKDITTKPLMRHLF